MEKKEEEKEKEGRGCRNNDVRKELVNVEKMEEMEKVADIRTSINKRNGGGEDGRRRRDKKVQDNDGDGEEISVTRTGA